MQTAVSLSQAAKMVGIQRSTLYRHIEEKPISVMKEEGAHPKIDISELIRVYGDKVKLPNNNKSKSNNEEIDNRPIVSDNTKNDTIQDRIRINTLETQLESQIKHERNLEDQIEYLKDQLKEEKEERKKATAMLTDQREKSDKVSDWDKSMKAMEARISNQEQTAKEEKELAQKILRQNQILKKKLEEEKNKSFWKKLFG